MLTGEVDDIRTRASYRYAHVGFASETTWEPELPGVEVVHREPRAIRMRVTPDVDPAGLLADAEQHGKVTEFTFAPPDLSEVFFEVVGHTPGRSESEGAA